MDNNGWNTTDLILANQARNMQSHHIKYDGFLKNIIKAGVQNWFSDIDRYVDEYHGTPYGHNYGNGYHGGRSYPY